MKIYLTSIFLSIAKSGTTVTEGAEGAAMPASAASCAFFEESSSTLPSMRFWIIQSGKIVHRKKAPQRHSGYCHTPYRGPWQDSACGGSPNEAFLPTIMLHRKKAPQRHSGFCRYPEGAPRQSSGAEAPRANRSLSYYHYAPPKKGTAKA